MRKGFNFEANLPHQKAGVDSVINIFKDTIVSSDVREYQNNKIEFNQMSLVSNIKDIQSYNQISHDYISSDPIFDIHMETGTGKTYTYTQTIFELNKRLGLFKFIIVVPTVAIKAGTVNFLKAPSTKEHFRSIYNKDLKIHVVESKENKGKKAFLPPSISEFVRSNKMSKHIQVLVINSGMINSKTIESHFDTNLLDKYNVPIDGIKACLPITIVDEPHKFPDSGKTFNKLLKFNSQLIIRYGATFKDKKNNFTYKNLLYSLNSIQAFNQDLVKGLNAHVLSFEDGEDCHIKLIETDGIEATFELNNNQRKSRFKLAKSEYLDHIHPQINHLMIEKLNKTKVVLDNGLELTRGSLINPYSYANTTQEHMIKNTIKKHFELERELLTRDVKIKPLTLFFIDNINAYRMDNNQNGELANLVESLIESEVKHLLKGETNQFYKQYLQTTLSDLRACHGGYFSKDNSGKDEQVEKEINEIIHDKETLLDLDNPRRFIFSKWTLKEGWDNPNVFQICKLRSSGSETSKLQEVGRGLRIPVNQYMERVKDEQFELNYFIDFTEKDFVTKLTKEININQITLENEVKLEEQLISKICDDYKISEDSLLANLDNLKIINRQNNYQADGLDKLKSIYPLSFEKLKSGKVKNSGQVKDKINIRQDNYLKLQSLWEEINQKVILEYQFDNEEQVKELFFDCLNSSNLYENKLVINSYALNKQTAHFNLHESLNKIETSIVNLKYSDFILELSNKLNLNIQSIHSVLSKLLNNNILNINDYLNYETIRIIVNQFKNYLIEHVHSNYQIEYNQVSNQIHPTILTKKDGQVKDNIKASLVGVDLDSDVQVANNYLFDQVYFDSQLERLNMIEEIKDVVVFTKIPKESIKIPIVGGYTYSPDFAYVIEYESGQKQLNFIVETKNKDLKDLSIDETNKILSAEKLFSSDFFEVKFKKQMKNQKIIDLISEIVD